MTWLPKDSKGIHLQNVGRAEYSINVSGNQTNLVLLTARGVLYRLVVTKAITGGTFSLTNNDGTTLFPGDLDYGGTYHIGEYFTNGVKITTSNFGSGHIRAVLMPFD